MESDLQYPDYLDVREMTREELLSYFYNYIDTKQYINKHYTSISERLRRNEGLRANKLANLDNKYESFYYDNLLIHEAEAKEKLNRKKPKKNIKNILKSIPTYMKILIILGLLLLLGPGGIGSAIGTLIVLPIAFVIIFFVLLLVAPWAVGFVSLFLGGIISFLYKIVNAIAKLFGSSIKQLHYDYVIKKARQKDILSAKKKGITKENAREIFEYNNIKNEINNEYNELERKIKIWRLDETNEIKNKHQVLNKKLLLPEKKLEYVIYMYNQLSIGANDNWKEAINDLKLEIRHEDLKNELKSLSHQISQSNDNLHEMSRKLDRQFADLDRMVSFETGRIDSRLDGIYDNIDLMYYY